VVLTGGAGLYGRGLAAQIAAAGATLVLASRNLDALKRIAAEECAKGRDVHARQFDRGEEESILARRDGVVRDFGRIDGLVNNAVARPMKSPEAPAAAWAASMRTNATALFVMTRAFGDAMADRKTVSDRASTGSGEESKQVEW